MCELRSGGVVRVYPISTNHRDEPRPGWWEARYDDPEGNGGITQNAEKDHVLRWAAERGARTCLVQDPDTGEWSQWPQPGT
ncbi:hypothetical protein SAMN04489717_0356 [Actinopolymorpha singaporensis]|uniref:Uncharacterized protein n=1 Tax=Actinopolymorpha singaporensis TaxID=117157 RepID=A0A1H1LJU6_9ACTN|nr:hypothetical protein SAMN04489717_0356 [Actinopolymorpha singaporensis]